MAMVVAVTVCGGAGGLGCCGYSGGGGSSFKWRSQGRCFIVTVPC